MEMDMKRKKTKSTNVVRRVRIIGEGRDERDKRYFKFSVQGRRDSIPPFSVDQIINDPKELFSRLCHAGWNGFTPKARNELLAKLQARRPENPSFRVVTRVGWNSRAYVFPDEIVGTPRRQLETVFAGLDSAMLAKYRIKGSLKEWQDRVARLAVRNTRLMFAISLAFTGPILRLVDGSKSGGFQIWGDAEAGKTTAAMVAGSVWGCHRAGSRRDKGFLEGWYSTSGKVDVTALAHNDNLLILNETNQAGKDDKERANVVTSVSFALAEQTEKERLTKKHPLEHGGATS
jgi:putative DNA primase/helicase